MARPPKLTPELLGQLEELRSRGGSAKTIARRLGISPRTVTRARARLRELEPAPAPEPAVEVVPPSLLDDPRLEQALLQAVLRASSLDWRAAAWWLERAFPERWAHPSLRRRDEWGDARERRQSAWPPSGDDDPFTEIDQLAEKRRRRRWAGTDDG